MTRGIQFGVYALAFMLGACSEQKMEPDEAVAGKPESTSVQKPQGEEAKANTVSSRDHQVSGAIADLAIRIGLPADAIKVKQANAVQWSDGALGCPKEGMNYTQVIVPGILVVLEANGEFYRYHGRTSGDLFYCPEERAKAPGYGPGQAFM